MYTFNRSPRTNPTKRHPEALPGLDGERGWRAHRAHDRDAGDGRLLDDLEGEPTAHLEHVVGERHTTREDLLAHDLVDGVVATDVLTDRDESSLGGEQSRGVQPTGAIEDLLRLPEGVREAEHRLDGHRRPRRDRSASHLDVVEGRFAADTAGRRRVEVPLQQVEVERTVQRDRHDVVLLILAGKGVAVGDPAHIPWGDQAFREQEPDGELEVAARCPHRDGHRSLLLSRTLHADLERLLRGQRVGSLRPDPVVHRDDVHLRGVPSERLGCGRHHHDYGPSQRAEGRDQWDTAAAAISETSSRFQNRSSANGAIRSGTTLSWTRSAIVTPTIGVALNP